MKQEEVLKIAQLLYTSEKEIMPISEPLTQSYPQITVEDAYKIQLANVKRRLEEGAIVIGKKIGLTSVPMQQMLGVPEPDYGHLLDNMIVDEEIAINANSLLQPKVEAEIIFVLKKELKGPGVTLAQVLQATEGVFPAFEIIDSRIKDWKIKIEDTVADNASSALFIIGSQMVSIKDLNLKYVGMVLEKNGSIIDTAAGAAVLGHPAIAVAWLANKLAEYDISLKPGELILSGSLTKAYEVKSGDVFTATFGNIGRVKATFE